MNEMLTSGEAIAELQRLEKLGAELLGLDGFKLHPDGRYEAPIELILDFTAAEAPRTTPAKRFDEARRFVTANDAAHMRWEIVSGSRDK